MLHLVSFIVTALSVASFTIGVSLGLFHVVKRLNAVSRIRKRAKKQIGEEVSIYSDKGARLAYKGICASLSEDYSKALTYFEKAMTFSGVSHNSVFCLEWMAKCYDAQEKPMELMRSRVKAVQLEPSNLKSLFGLADLYVRNGLYSKAEFYYNRILRYDNDNIAARFMLGTLFMGRGFYDEAEAQFIKALEIDKETKAASAELSVIMAIKGDYDKMEHYYAKAKDDEYADADRLKKRLSSIKKVKDLCNDY